MYQIIIASLITIHCHFRILDKLTLSLAERAEKRNKK